ncbi:proteasome endopeptidase complex, partial [Sarracenia purpurea var. burkii]
WNALELVLQEVIAPNYQLLQATSAGLKEQEAINFLEKKMKNDHAFSYKETVQVRISCFITGKGGFMH